MQSLRSLGGIWFNNLTSEKVESWELKIFNYLLDDWYERPKISGWKGPYSSKVRRVVLNSFF